MATQYTKASAKRIRAGELLLDGEAKSTREALVKVGYSINTAVAPTKNGLAPDRLMLDALAFRGVSKRDTRKLAQEAIDGLKDLAADDEQPGSTRGAAWKALLDHAQANPETDPELGPAALPIVRRHTLALARKLLLFALARPEAAQIMVERLRVNPSAYYHGLDGLHAREH